MQISFKFIGTISFFGVSSHQSCRGWEVVLNPYTHSGKAENMQSIVKAGFFNVEFK